MLQAFASAITINTPECLLMVVLVDERPEEVTDMQRAVDGEVIASTFDRPAEDHTTVAELAIERAKRLVELGHDVVVLLDSITRLGRAYNLAAPASGRIMSGGVDSTADRKSTRLNSSHVAISYAVFCLKKKTKSHSAVIAQLMSAPLSCRNTSQTN